MKYGKPVKNTPSMVTYDYRAKPMKKKKKKGKSKR